MAEQGGRGGLVGATSASGDEPAPAPTGPVELQEPPVRRGRHARPPAQRRVGSGVAAMVFLLVPAAVFVLGGRPVAFENRALAAFPSVTERGFFAGLPPWATDHLPLRQQAVQAADGISTGVFGEPFPVGASPDAGPLGGPVAPVAPGQESPAGGAPTGNAAPQVDDDLSHLKAAGFPAVVTGRDGWLYYGFDAYATCYPTRSVEDIVNRLNRLRSAVEGSGRTFTLVVAPDKSTVVPEHLPDSFAGSSCVEPRKSAFWSAITTRAGVLDLRSTLAGVDVRAQAYSKTDTHWTFRSGEVMTRAVAESLAPGSTTGWSVAAGQQLTYTGDLSLLSGSSLEVPFEVPRLKVDGRDRTVERQLSYRAPVVLGTPTGNQARRWAFVGDSFAHFATPYVPAAAPGSSLVHLETARSDPAGVARSMAGGRDVVVEVSERNLDSGVSPVLDDAFLASVDSVMAADPVR